MSRNKKVVLIFGGFVAAIGLAFYPIFFHPLMHIEEYRKEQSINRAEVKQEDVQPTGLKVWYMPIGTFKQHCLDVGIVWTNIEGDDQEGWKQDRETQARKGAAIF